MAPIRLWRGSIHTIAGIASGLIFVCVSQQIPATAASPTAESTSTSSSPGDCPGRRHLRRLAAAVAHLRSSLRRLLSHRLDLARPDPIPRRGGPTSTDESPQTAQATSFDANRRRAMAILSTGCFFHGGGYLVVLAGPVFGATAAASTWLTAGIATVAAPLTWSAVAARIGTAKPHNRPLLSPELRRAARGLRLYPDRPDHRRGTLRLRLHRGRDDDDRHRHTDGSRERLGETDVLVQHRADRRT